MPQVRQLLGAERISSKNNMCCGPRDDGIGFERFLIDRFIDFANKREGRAFEFKEKRDLRVRNKPSYDYLFVDRTEKGKLRIEVKRVISKELEWERRIENWARTGVINLLSKFVSGNYLIAISYQELKSLGSKSAIREFFRYLVPELKKHIRSKATVDICPFPKTSLIYLSDSPDQLYPFLSNLSTAGRDELLRLIIAASKKFRPKQGSTARRVLLLMEQSATCQRNALNSILENGGFAGDIAERIDEIYYIAISRLPAIARVFPPRGRFRSIFFRPAEYMQMPKYLNLSRAYFSPRK